MAGRFKLQQPNILEIRGVSRGSIIDQTRLEPLRSGLIFYDSLMDNVGSDDDDSTITDDSDTIRRSAPNSPSHTEDTITASDASPYWSAEQSFITGNTTERSSVYSWGDDEFDHQASRQVRQMFQAIEQMLFEGVLSGSTTLQHECREWMSSFPHLRILGKQLVPPRDEGFQSVPSSSKTSAANSFAPSPLETSESDGLMVKGCEVNFQPVPARLLPAAEVEGSKPYSSIPVPGSDLSHLREEIFEQDGSVEEYLAYDIKEMDDDENTKRYHVPRRRRLGFPPITPNACVRDAVLHQVFDNVWSGIVNCLSTSSSKFKTSLLKAMLVQDDLKSMDHSMSNKSYAKSLRKKHAGDKLSRFDPMWQQPLTIHPANYSYFPRGSYDDDEDIFQSMRLAGGPGAYFGPPMIQSLSIPPHLLYSKEMGLPPSRNSNLDQLGGMSRHIPLAAGRLSTAPTGDMNSLNDLMKISQKKLQVRSDKPAAQNDEPVGNGQNGRLSMRPSSSSFGNGLPNAGLGVAHHLSTLGISNAPSPLASTSRPFTSRDIMPSNASRQTSATTRKSRFGRPPRLLPLDSRAKTPNVDFDGYVKATRLTRPGENFGSVSSPPHNLQPPPTAPSPSTGSTALWVNPRLPPITSSLESLHENALLDFKKTRGKTAHTRISSAVADDKQVYKGLDYVSRPNTTHTFRADNLIPKRATSVTPSNFAFGAHSSSVNINNQKSASPSGAFFQNSPNGSGVPLPQHSHSPDNFSGLVGITGKGINMVGTAHPSSPEEDPVNQASWGQSSQSINPHVRRKRIVALT